MQASTRAPAPTQPAPVVVQAPVPVAPRTYTRTFSRTSDSIAAGKDAGNVDESSSGSETLKIVIDDPNAPFDPLFADPAMRAATGAQSNMQAEIERLKAQQAANARPVGRMNKDYGTPFTAPR